MIASIISALSAVTTSFRAIGVSKEFSHHQSDAVLRTSCRIAGLPAGQPVPQRSSMKLHIAVTIIWYLLSIIFSVPFLIHKTESGSSNWLFVWIAGYLLLTVIIYFLWKKALRGN
ncbi:MAG: hypothetical protein AB1499_12505 [Nitrospirota bacterium]